MRILLGLLLLFPGVVFAEDAVQTWPPCRLLLELSAQNQRRIAELVRRGPPSDIDAIAFVPMTASELRRLALNGVSRHREEYSVYANLENPTVARWKMDRPEYKVSEWPRPAREPMLENEAWVRSMIELIAERARLSPQVPHMFGWALQAFFTEVRPMHPRLRDEPFSPDFERLARAAAEIAELPFEEPFTCDLETTGFLEEMLNAGPNYSRLVARQRLRALTCILGIYWDNIDSPFSHARHELTELFKDLPGHAGFRVALDAKAFNRIRWSGEDLPKLYNVDISFVTGIEAFGEIERQTLDELVRVTYEPR